MTRKITGKMWVSMPVAIPLAIVASPIVALMTLGIVFWLWLELLRRDWIDYLTRESGK